MGVDSHSPSYKKHGLRLCTFYYCVPIFAYHLYYHSILLFGIKIILQRIFNHHIFTVFWKKVYQIFRRALGQI